MTGKCRMCPFEAALIKDGGLFVLPEHGHAGEPCSGELMPPEDGSPSENEPE